MKFEGAEKKLEIILFSPQTSLRSNIDNRWDNVVKASRAAVISKISTHALDAYLLSESSLFVWDDRILMITCGRTTLARALPEILSIVGRDNVAFVFYEQKNFLFPHDQPSSFEDDTAFITAYCPGKIYRFGPANDDHVNVFYWSQADAGPERDATLQILLNDPDPFIMEIFYEKNSRTAIQARERSGVYDICSREMRIDDCLFSPYGYSLNGIFETNYFTVHITPQPESAYVSFETNIIEKDYSGIIKKVVSAFKPKRFSIVLTTSKDDHFSSSHSAVANGFPGYDMMEKSLYEFDSGYAVTFLNYKPKLSAHPSVFSFRPYHLRMQRPVRQMRR
ncbi:hypothetical protein [Desulfonema magnum]|uniref:Adenosylmethionine decarboxylase n=1 Tax=Desulfonema magnum TaxID=45655 RepID=A0A975GQC4_9BACT|nr:hypothetical protein [Desulfonema magnum]QTA89760.1 Adenosylmethionine decarboxylase [Desulfonema magnum]